MTNKDIKLNTDDSTKLAKSIISNLGQITEKERGEVITNVAISYIKIMNDLNKKHIEALKKTLALFKDIKKEEKEEDEKAKLLKLRAELNK